MSWKITPAYEVSEKRTVVIPTCKYAILEYFKSETSLDGVPLLLILDIEKRDSKHSLKAFIPSTISDVVAKMQPSPREWILSLLSDFCRTNSEMENAPEELFELLSNLAVGPLRSSRRGLVEFRDIESALRLIRRETIEFSTPEDAERRFFRSQPLNKDDVQSLLQVS
jgi:hypothetical protein